MIFGDEKRDHVLLPAARVSCVTCLPTVDKKHNHFVDGYASSVTFPLG
jgi:hypothetical protein